ncbi:MAG: enoyl-CoA hydratase/isomerase family protein [Acetobacteraceae bacterium]|nr:enoyl-CoA hydratase/isomerase family protein [Acetobacteraceae bacterium]
MSLVETALADGVLTVTLNRPDRGNALDEALVAALRAAVGRAEDPAVRLLVLRGAGRALCTGFDIGGIESETDAGLLARFVAIELLLQAVRHAPVPSIALGHGRMFGAGADLFAACTWRIADPAARFAFPGARFGLVLGTRRLASLVGEAQALALTTRGQGLDAHAAQECGLATALAAQDRWGADIAAIAAEVARVDRATAHALATAARPDTRDADLAALVRSAAAPGLAARVAAYAAGRG